MNPPAPACVRYVMKFPEHPSYTSEETKAFLADPRYEMDEILRDNIRAVCAEMREEVNRCKRVAHTSEHNPLKFALLRDHTKTLENFADKLEGREA